MSQDPLSTALTQARAGRFREALAALRRAPEDPSPRTSTLRRVLLAELLECTGDLEGARQQARDVLGLRHVDPTLQARCYVVLGLIAAHGHGEDWQDALRYFQKAIRLAMQVHDHELAVRAQLRLLANLADMLAPDALRTLVKELKRQVGKDRQVDLLALLHCELARLEAIRGAERTARRHIREALTLAEGLHNVWLLGKAHLHASAVAFLAADLRTALVHAEHALRYSEDSGHFPTTAGALVNVAALRLWTGKAEDGEAGLRRALSAAKALGGVAASALINLALGMLASGRLDEAEALLAQARQVAPPENSWWNLWIAWAQVELLRERRAWSEIQQLATKAGTEAARSQPHGAPLLRLAAVEAAVELGALDEVVDALEELDATSLSIAARADLERVKAKALAAIGQNGRARTSLARALRLDAASSEFLGFHRAARDFAHLFGEPAQGTLSWAAWYPWRTDGAPPSGPRAGATVIARQDDPRSGIEDIALLLELVDRPALLGYEAFYLVATSGHADWAVLATTRPGHGHDIVDYVGCSLEEAHRFVRSTRPNDRLVFGEIGDASLYLAAEPRPDLQARLSLATLRRVLQSILTLQKYREEEKRRDALWPDDGEDPGHFGIYAADASRELMATARKVARTDVPVLITGETGTGKELLARAIHHYSKRAARNFVPFNCKSVPHDMLDSQLFGYRRGAFTGALQAFPGVVRAAAGGTLLLDEIGDLDLDLQPKLLRFLERGEIHPLAEPQPLKVDVRIIAATNADLEQLVADGRFREDLYYRLNVIRFALPPLRERREEIPALAAHFLHRHGAEQGKADLRLSDEALEYLLLYSWPGNIRQLENEIRRAVVLVDHDYIIRPEHLSPALRATRRTLPAADSGRPSSSSEIVLSLDQPLPTAVRELEHAMIRYALAVTNGRVEQAARRLGLSRKGLFLKRRRLGFTATETA